MKTKKLIWSIAGLVVVVAAIFVIAFTGKKAPVADTANYTGPSAPSSQAVPSAQVPAADTAETQEYKDGSYSATGTYISPGGTQHVGVALTIKDDIVTSASFTPEPSDGTSARYQGKFASGFEAQVVGQSLASLNLTRVSGSSLTPIGFNDAVAEIKAEAKA